MALVVPMPQLGLEVTEGTVTDIHVAVGQRVAKDDVVLELATDKAQTDVVAPRAGVVEAIDVEIGDPGAVGGVLLRWATDKPSEQDVSPDAGDGAPPPPPLDGARLRAAPVARRAALKLGVELESVTGTGPRGRITLDDVRRAADAQPEPKPKPKPKLEPAPAAAGTVEPLSPLRRAVARRMTTSQAIPQFHLSREIDASALLASDANVNDLLVQAVAETVVRHRALSAAYVEEGPALRYAGEIGVGLAVATPGGLVVPVVRRADRLTLAEIATQREWLVAAARAGRLSLEDMTGGTITVSNLGGAGVDAFAAMVNPGEAAILAVGRVGERLVSRDRGIAVQPTLTLTMTFDHRVVDGAAGGDALAELASLLEGDMRWRT